MLLVMPPVKSRREQYTESTRDAVLGSATELFSARGYTHTSLDEVAAHARVTKGAIYHHFSNKAALLTAAVERQEVHGNARIRATYARESAESGPMAGTVAALDEFLTLCSESVYGALVFREAPIALGWQEWRACQAEYAVALLEDMMRGLIAAEVIRGPVSGTVVSVVLGMLSSAGQLLAETPSEGRAQVRDELRSTFGAFITGLSMRP